MSTLKTIADGYFTTYGRTPKKSYTDEDIYNIIQTAMMQLRTFTETDNTALWNFKTYLETVAQEYGVNLSEAVDYVQGNPYYEEYITNTAKNSVQIIDPGLGDLLGYVGSSIGGGIGNFLSGGILSFLKKILPVIIIAVLLYIGYKYYSRK